MTISESADSGLTGASAAVPHRSLRELLWVVFFWLLFVSVTSFLGERTLAEHEARPETAWRSAVVANEITWARWDAFWYQRIAEQGYSVSQGEQSSVAFFPLYPVLMGGLSEILNIDAMVAGLWISRLSLLVVLALLMVLSRSRFPEDPLAPLIALLVFPMAFILVSVYTESLFLACVLGAFVAFQRRAFVLAGLLGLLAGLTRFHGLALSAALIVLAVRQRREGGGRAAFVSAVAPVGGLLVLVVVFAVLYHDPLLYFHSHDAWNQHLTAPWVAVFELCRYVFEAWWTYDWLPLGATLELVCMVGLAVSVVLLVRRDRVPEAVFVGVVLALQLLSGGTRALPRFTVFCFPVFLLAAELQRRTVAWNLYLIVSALWQSMLLVKYVHYLTPYP